MPVVPANQLTLSLDPTLTQRFKTLRQCLHATVLRDPRGVKAVAADCDLSESELSRRLSPKSPDDPRSLDVDLMVEILASTGDFMPIDWLVSRFVPNDQHRRAAALQQFERLMTDAAGMLRHLKEFDADPAAPSKSRARTR